MAYKPPEGFRSDTQTALLLGISPFGLREWRRRGYGPTPRKIGRRVVYAEADIQTFLNSVATTPID